MVEVNLTHPFVTDDGLPQPPGKVDQYNYSYIAKFIVMSKTIFIQVWLSAFLTLANRCFSSPSSIILAFSPFHSNQLEPPVTFVVSLRSRCVTSNSYGAIIRIIKIRTSYSYTRGKINIREVGATISYSCR